MKVLDGKTIVDWDDHQKLFRELLELTDKARLLVIHNKALTGKSTLLIRLKYICENEEAVPVSLVPLEDQGLKGSFEMVNHLRNELVDFQLPFPRFDQLNLARVTFDMTPFGPASGPSAGTVNASGAHISGGTQAGIVNQNVEKLYASGPPPTGWTNPAFEQIATDGCVKAFFEDLKEICQQKTVVLLFDSWDPDRGSGALRKWIQLNLLRPLCFDLQQRPERLVIVIAGREEFNLGPHAADLVRSKPPKIWDKNDIKQFVELHGYKDALTEDDWAWLFTKFKDETFTLGQALQFLAVFNESN